MRVEGLRGRERQGGTAKGDSKVIVVSFVHIVHKSSMYFIPGIIFVTGNSLEYKKQKTGIGEQSCIVQPQLHTRIQYNLLPILYYGTVLYCTVLYCIIPY